MQTFLNALVAKLPKRFQRAAKAFIPFAVISAGAAADLAFSGAELRQLIAEGCAAAQAVLTYYVPNRGQDA